MRTNPSILIIDDDPMLCELLALHLSFAGYDNVRVAEDAVILQMEPGDRDREAFLTWYLGGGSASLSKLLPVLQCMGVEVLEELLRAGMSVARFNFSHGSHEYHQVTRIFFFSLFLSER